MYDWIKADLYWNGRSWEYTVKAPVRGVLAVVLTDNVRGTATKVPDVLWRQAEEDVAAVRRVMMSGHRFEKTWAELVDEAPEIF